MKSVYPNLTTWHCLSHRLEIAVGDSVVDVRGVNHFKIFLDRLYSLFSASSKNQREITKISNEISSQFLKIGRILDVRWVASSFRTVNAVWRSFSSLHAYFKSCIDDSKAYDSKERQRFRGLYLRLGSIEFLLDLALMYDVLNEISNLSLQLQRQNITLTEADRNVKRTIRVLSSFKDTPGEMVEEAMCASKSMTFQGVSLSSNNKIISINRNKLIQSLVDRMNSRLCSAAPDNVHLLDCLKVLDCSTWPMEPSIRYGEKEVRYIAKRFQVNETNAINGMREWIDIGSQKQIPAKLTEIMTSVKTIPCSSAECERDFSIMNNIVSDIRSTILVANCSNLMFLKINGPPLRKWDPKKYVNTWLLHHRTATDTQSRKQFIPSTRKDECHDSMWKIM